MNVVSVVRVYSVAALVVLCRVSRGSAGMLRTAPGAPPCGTPGRSRSISGIRYADT